MTMSFNWKNALIKCLNDPSMILYKDDIVAIIRDAYPKSRHHYLVLSLDKRLNSLADLNGGHVPLVKHMYNQAREYASKIDTNYGFKYGFHMYPSMNRLHLHLISMDHDSVSMKHKAHYNSFNTAFFVPPEKVINDLEAHGKVNLLPEEETEKLLKGPLKCHFCDQIIDKFANLRKHLQQHYQEYDP